MSRPTPSVPRRLVVLGVAVALVLGACTGGSPRAGSSRSASPGSPTPSQSQAAPATPDPLCTPVPPSTEQPPAGATLPPVVEAVADQVERARGLTFLHPVVPELLSRSELAAAVREALDRQFPVALARRQERALITIGALPEGTDLHQALADLQSSRVVGFYDPDTQRLVFESGADPTPFQRYTLAHELTHALDDQHFDLGRLSELANECQDERYQAFLALAEGDAVETQVLWARSNLSDQEILQLQAEAASYPGPPDTVPRFVQEAFSFPYPNGQSFIEALTADGGERAVNDAFQNPPTSTEQVLHPDRYPEDQPQDVEVPDLTDRLGSGWSALDREGVGEGFLRVLLQLRLSSDRADEAAAGWDGGQFRAWSKGSQTAVLMESVWDSDQEAGEFVDAMREWLGDRVADVRVDGGSVDVLFASSPSTLDTLEAAVA